MITSVFSLKLCGDSKNLFAFVFDLIPGVEDSQ